VAADAPDPLTFSTLAAFEAAAREQLPPAVIDYVAGGSWDEVTLYENTAAFRQLRFRPSVLSGVTQADLSTTILGQPAAIPLGVAPMAQYGWCHPEAELPAASAAAAAGWTFALSTLSTRSLEEVASGAAGSVASPGAAGQGPRWFQLYIQADLGFSRSLVERAAAAGYSAVVVTVDLPAVGYRGTDLRAGQLRQVLGNFPEADARARTAGARPALTWELIAAVRSWSRLPLLIKGILTAEDACRAVEHGLDGIVVSNHGGRQLDRTPASIDALREVVPAVEGRAEVFLDGGVRRGLDVVLALALGAKAVFIGRPILYALSVGGEAGVARAMQIVRLETERAMVLLGAGSVRELTPKLVQVPTG
jgi:4-hydroxymandelate oxidase